MVLNEERDEMEAGLPQKPPIPPDAADPAPEVAQWLSVSGDIDDLIYHDHPPRQSEK